MGGENLVVHYFGMNGVKAKIDGCFHCLLMHTGGVEGQVEKTSTFATFITGGNTIHQEVKED